MKKLISLMSLGVLLFVVTPTFATESSSDSHVKSPKQMVNINTAGQASLTGTLVSASATSLTVSSWGGNWVINLATDAKLVASSGIKALSADFNVGDAIKAQGKANSTSAWAIDARNVQDITLQMRNESFMGTVSAVSGNTFTLTTKKKGTLQVTANADAKFMLKGKTATVADLSNGATVTVSGVYNVKALTVAAKKIVITPTKEKKME